jgi:hypothetical protein
MYPGLLLTASATTTVGWQETDGGNSVTELEGSFAVALASNATYVEIYQVDCANPANWPAFAAFTAR